jgi:uncharacterized membrane protein YbhN (UPF0104 family)
VLASRVVRIGFVVVTVALGLLAVVTEWHGIRDAVTRLRLATLGGSLAFVVASLLVSMVLWRVLIAGLGSPLPYSVAARVIFTSQLGKYLPGSVWPVLAQMELGRDNGVPRRRSLTAFLLLMLYSAATGLLVATALVPFVAAAEVRPFRWAFLLMPVLLVALHPRVLNPVLDRALRVARRPPLEHPLTWQLSARAVAIGVVQWMVMGAHVWILGVQLGADPVTLAPLAVGGFALAWCVGYLGVVSPAGLGVREVALVAVLSPVLSPADAIVVAVASRVIMTVADLLLAGGSALSLGAGRAKVKEPVA